MFDDHHCHRRNNRSSRCKCTPLFPSTSPGVLELHAGTKVAVSFHPNSGKWLADKIVLSVDSQLAEVYHGQIEVLLKLPDLFDDTWSLPRVTCVGRIIVWGVYMACA